MFTNDRPLHPMQPRSIQDRIRALAFELLGKHPTGLSCSNLTRDIALADPGLNQGTIRTVVSSLDKVCADHIYTPSRGVYRLAVFNEVAALDAREEVRRQAQEVALETKVTALFTEWLEDELQDVIQAMTPPRHLFDGLCGTPTVLGLAAAPSEAEVAPKQGVVSAQIESKTSGFVAAFGQACAARLFARRSYLVVSRRKRAHELMHAYGLCRMFGLGLVLYDDLSSAAPGFRLAVYAVDHCPDPIHESRYISQLEAQL